MENVIPISPRVPSGVAGLDAVLGGVSLTTFLTGIWL